MKKNTTKALSVSIMCADLLNLEHELQTFQALKVEMIHIDVMDAHFVPNLTFGPDFINAMRKKSSLVFDTHLMMTNPMTVLEKIDIQAGDFVTVHAEILPEEILRVHEFVRRKGGKLGLAINPHTDVRALGSHLEIIDLVLVMLVQPGFAGAKMVDGIMDKVKVLDQFLAENDRADVLISVDGSVSAERAALMSAMGANVFVGGTAGIFKKDISLSETVPAFHAVIK